MVSVVETRHKTQKTVKAFENDIALINEQAKRLGCSAAEVIHEMCEALRKQVYLQELGESFDLVRGNAKQLAELEAEQKVWDSALADGLDNAS
jgi:phosphoribosylformylglycinamidine (FGAM) synthase-like enzyme